MAQGPKVTRWGIIATGGISETFCQDLLVDPSTRGVSDVKHTIAAVGSRSASTAKTFVDKLKSASGDQGWKWGVENGLLDNVNCGTYEDVYNNPDVDVVYIGTPHTLHHRNAKDALLAGKPVLVEKAVTLDVEELDELVSIAKEKNLFLMEAVWTRFHPLGFEVEKVLQSGVLGKPKRFSADFSMDWNPDGEPETHRMLQAQLGGGSLLDQGAYPSVWAMLLAHRHPSNTDQNPQVLNSHQTVYERTNVDLNSRWLVEWKGLCQGQLMTDLDSAGLREATAVLQCEEGDLVIAYPPYKSETFYIVPRPDRFMGKIKEKTTHHHPVAEGNNGMSYEADHVARCLRDGKIESERMPWAESRVVQGWMDVVRKNGKTGTAQLKGTAGQ